MNKIDILVVSENFCNHTLTFVYNSVKYLDSSFKTAVLTNRILNEDRFPYNNIYSTNLVVNKLDQRIKHILKSKFKIIPKHNLKLKKELLKIANVIEPEIIYIHFGFNLFLFYSNLPKTWQQKKIIVQFHGVDTTHTWLEINSYRKKIKSLITKNNVIPSFVSYEMKNRFLNELGVNPNKGKILRCGINVDFFKKQNTVYPNEDFIFLQVSSFKEKKGHLYTIRAFKEFLNKTKVNRAKLILAGEGELLESMKSLVSQLNLTNYVEFPGLIDSLQIRAYMNNSNVFVHHSVTSKNGDREGIPTVIMEAMLMELPILSTFHAGISELVENNINGYLSEEKDINDYSNKMYKSYLEYKKKKYAHNRSKVIKKFSGEAFLTQFSNIIKND